MNLIDFVSEEDAEHNPESCPQNKWRGFGPFYLTLGGVNGN